MGQEIIARPTPIPPTTRQSANCPTVEAIAHPIVEARNAIADNIIVRRRPIASANQRPRNGPMIAPEVALLAAQPVNADDSENSRDRKGRAPAMSARS